VLELVAARRKGRLECLGEPLEAVDGGDRDIGDAALAQIVVDGQPELGALGLVPSDPQDALDSSGIAAWAVSWL
jgi:hypothetical protein